MSIGVVSVVCPQNDNEAISYCSDLHVKLIGSNTEGLHLNQIEDFKTDTTDCPSAGFKSTANNGAGFDFDCNGFTGENLVVYRKTDLKEITTLKIMDLAIYPKCAAAGA